MKNTTLQITNKSYLETVYSILTGTDFKANSMRLHRTIRGSSTHLPTADTVNQVTNKINNLHWLFLSHLTISSWYQYFVKKFKKMLVGFKVYFLPALYFAHLNISLCVYPKNVLDTDLFIGLDIVRLESNKN